MKKKKLIGLASLLFVLGAAGCGGGDTGENGDNGNGNGTNQPTECTKHTWGEYEVVTPADCTNAGKQKRKCSVCNKEEEKTIRALGHDYKDDATGAVAPSCTEVGSQPQTCSRCGVKRNVEVAALGHDWVDDETGGTPATCEEAGKKNQHCSRCTAVQTDVEVPATGHSYGEYTTVTAATCEADGLEQRTCETCGKVDDHVLTKLGHAPTLVGEPTPATGEKAAVRLYECANGCGQTFLGFLASEPSTASKSHLTFTEPNEKGEIGASFWGRPIGNSLALNPANGDSVNQQNNECVYCRDETGDFFEYIFDLTAEQAALLSTCRCYCDAKPANYLSGDFWAYNASADDWTPGYYIDDDPDHIEMETDPDTNQPRQKMVKNHTVCDKDSSAPGDELDDLVPMGKRITDYRYVLYVDDVVQDFDPDTKVTVEGSGTNTVRKEYEMPYTFHLHEGTNKISLRMAGGYRSVFYNFTFRPYVAPTPITVAANALEVREGKTVAITGISEEGVTFKSDKESVATVDANGVITGVKAGTANITVSKAGNFKPATVAVTVLEKEGVVTLNLTDAVIAPAEGGIEEYNSSSSGKWYRNPKANTTLTYTFQSELAGKFDIQLGLRGSGINLAEKMAIKVNDADVAVAGTVQTQYSAVDYVVGQADLVAGSNTMVISFPADSELYIKTLKLIPHVHTFGAVTDVAAVDGGAMAHGEAVCACGAKKVSLNALAGAFASGSSNKGGTPDGFLKLNANNNSISYTFEAAAAGKATFAVEAVMDNFGGGNGSNNTRTLESGKGNGKPYNITFKIDYTEGGEAKTNDVDMSAIGKTPYDDLFNKVAEGETPVASGHSAVTTFEIGTGDVGAGMNTLTITRNGSYNFIIRTIYVIL